MSFAKFELLSATTTEDENRTSLQNASSELQLLLLKPISYSAKIEN